MLRTFIGINKYTPRAQEMADALLANNNICLPQGSDTYRQFCVEATKMLDALFQAHLEHSEALDGYVNTPKPAPATMRRCSDCCF
jgi:hypothetical protein